MTWTPSRIIALFLGLWIAVAPVAAAAPAAAMTANMSMSDDGGAGGFDDCPGKGMPSNDCVQFCANVLFVGIAPGDSGLILAVTGGDLQPGPRRTLNGQFPVPDPGPPRPTYPR
jgi:hypothetical protein